MRRKSDTSVHLNFISLSFITATITPIFHEAVCPIALSYPDDGDYCIPGVVELGEEALFVKNLRKVTGNTPDMMPALQSSPQHLLHKTPNLAVKQRYNS